MADHLPESALISPIRISRIFGDWRTNFHPFAFIAPELGIAILILGESSCKTRRNSQKRGGEPRG